MWWFKTAAEEAADNILNKKDGLLQQLGTWNGNKDFTPEEQAEMNQGSIKMVLDYANSKASENTDRSKARRNMAVRWMNLQIFLTLLFVYGTVTQAVWRTELFTYMTSNLNMPITVAITVFFWGSYGLIQHNNSRGKK